MTQVSFDFDGTLSKPHVQEYAKSLIALGHEVWILTSRLEKCEDYPWYNKTCEYCHQDLYTIANELEIPDNKIIFTNMTDKADIILEREDFNPIWHLDDDFIELGQIFRKTKCKAISVNTSSFIKKCNKLIE